MRKSEPKRQISSAARGTYYRARSRRFLEGEGYAVADLEKMFRVFDRAKPERVLWTKRDQLGADLLAVNAREVLFVQVRGGRTARSKVAAALREFARWPCPRRARQWVMVWVPRAREPQIVDVAEERRFRAIPVLQIGVSREPPALKPATR